MHVTVTIFHYKRYNQTHTIVSVGSTCFSQCKSHPCRFTYDLSALADSSFLDPRSQSLLYQYLNNRKGRRKRERNRVPFSLTAEDSKGLVSPLARRSD